VSKANVFEWNKVSLSWLTSRLARQQHHALVVTSSFACCSLRSLAHKTHLLRIATNQIIKGVPRKFRGVLGERLGRRGEFFEGTVPQLVVVRLLVFGGVVVPGKRCKIMGDLDHVVGRIVPNLADAVPHGERDLLL